jgi:hypothetical protein
MELEKKQRCKPRDMDKLKAIWKDSRERDFYLRWMVRIITLALVLYVALLKDRSRETIFVQPNAANERIIVIDHIIVEATEKDSLIQSKYESINYSGADADSLHAVITNYLKR